MSAEKQLIKEISATQVTARILARVGEPLVLAVLETLCEKPNLGTSARRLSRHLGVSRWHVEAALTILHHRHHVRFVQGRAVARNDSNTFKPMEGSNHA